MLRPSVVALQKCPYRFARIGRLTTEPDSPPLACARLRIALRGAHPFEIFSIQNQTKKNLFSGLTSHLATNPPPPRAHV
jgi:hypothetical protein